MGYGMEFAARRNVVRHTKTANRPSTTLALRTRRKEICKTLAFRYIAHMPQTPPVVLTIAGFDPFSGAGIAAHVKAVAAHGCYGVDALTALTVQSTAGLQKVALVKPDLPTEALHALVAD